MDGDGSKTTFSSLRNWYVKSLLVQYSDTFRPYGHPTAAYIHDKEQRDCWCNKCVAPFLNEPGDFVYKERLQRISRTIENSRPNTVDVNQSIVDRCIIKRARWERLQPLNTNPSKSIISIDEHYSISTLSQDQEDFTAVYHTKEDHSTRSTKHSNNCNVSRLAPAMHPRPDAWYSPTCNRC